MSGAGETVEVEIDGKKHQRSLRNIAARALMEGYSETPEQMRFALLSADLVLDAFKDVGIKYLVPLTGEMEAW